MISSFGIPEKPRRREDFKNWKVSVFLPSSFRAFFL